MGTTGSDIKKMKDWLDDEDKGGTPKPIDINKIKDKTLEAIERRERGLKHEELYVFDENDNLTAGYKGGPTSVSFPASLLSVPDITVTHGHPKGMEEFGGTFSFADVRNMLNSQWKEHRATAAGQGEMNYIMRRTDKSDANGLRTALDNAKPALKNDMTTAYKDAYKKAIAGGATGKRAQHIARQKAVGVLNRWYKANMPKYGYEYITRKKDYKYNR